MDTDRSFARLKTQEERIALKDHLKSEWNLYGIRKRRNVGTCSVIYDAAYEGRSVVLKIPLDDEEATFGMFASMVQRFHGGVPIYRFHEESGATLMDRLGRPLSESELSDDECVHIAADLIRWLHKSPLVDASPHEHWFRELMESPSGNDETLARAQAVAERLLATTTKRVLLHGDLHHFNILKAHDGWRSIDPKGVIGDPAFEPSAFLRNPIPEVSKWPNLQDVMRRRIETFASELLLSPARVWGWGFAQTTLASLWAEDEFGGHWQKLAEVLASLSAIYEAEI